MNKKKLTLIFGMILIALPAFALIKSNSYDTGKASGSEKCSAEIEGLKFCLESSKIVDSGKPVIINMTWSNSFEVLRRIGGIYTGYSVVVKDENHETLIPVREKKRLEKLKRMESPDATEEDKRGYIIVIHGSGGKSLYLEPKQSDTDWINLSSEYYDYDFSTKGKYNVTISKTIPSLEEGKTIEFVIDGIEIEVK